MVTAGPISRRSTATKKVGVHGGEAADSEQREARQLSAVYSQQVAPAHPEDDQQKQPRPCRAQLRETRGVHPVVEQVARHAAVEREECGAGGRECVAASGVTHARTIVAHSTIRTNSKRPPRSAQSAKRPPSISPVARIT